jgi:hypothetical protein
MGAIAESGLVGVYPLRVAPNRRHLVARRGAPFLIHGDSAWSLITALTREEADLYLTDRARKGFNSLIVNLIEHKFNGPINRSGEASFMAPGALSSPNDAYFAHADWVIRRAGHYGIQVVLAPLYLGAAGTDEGWIEEVLTTGVEAAASGAATSAGATRRSTTSFGRSAPTGRRAKRWTTPARPWQESRSSTGATSSRLVRRPSALRPRTSGAAAGSI